MLLIAACIAGVVYLRSGRPVSIRSNLTKIGDIEFSYRHFQNEDISPLCGCYEEQNPEKWRGVTFTTRRVRIERSGPEPITAYQVSAAEPEPIKWLSGGVRFKAELYFLSLPSNETFNPQLLLKGQLPATYQIINRIQFEPKRQFVFFSEKELNVVLLGDKPLGAWIPSDGSRVSVEYNKGMFPAAKVKGVIKETYHLRERLPVFGTVGMPLGDFLGPDVVLWSEDEKVFILDGRNVVKFPPGGTYDRKIAVLITHPPFSLRVACIGEDATAEAAYTDLVKKVSGPEQDYLPALRYKMGDSGTVKVQIEDVKEDAAEFAEVYKRMAEQDTITVPDIRGDFFAIDGETNENLGKFNLLPGMTFRYPPLPPNPGFNVFGSFSDITFNSAQGNLMLGTQPVSIGVPSALQLRDINFLKVEGGMVNIPIRWAAADERADVQLEATAKVFLNGEPVGIGFDSYRVYIEYTLIICTVISAIAAIVQVALARRSLKV